MVRNGLSLCVPTLVCATKKSLTHSPTRQHFWPSLLLFPVLGTVCRNTSRRHTLCLFFGGRLKAFLFRRSFPYDFYRNFCSACSVTVVIFGQFNHSFFHLLTRLSISTFDCLLSVYHNIIHNALIAALFLLNYLSASGARERQLVITVLPRQPSWIWREKEVGE